MIRIWVESLRLPVLLPEEHRLKPCELNCQDNQLPRKQDFTLTTFFGSLCNGTRRRQVTDFLSNNNLSLFSNGSSQTKQITSRVNLI